MNQTSSTVSSPTHRTDRLGRQLYVGVKAPPLNGILPRALSRPVLPLAQLVAPLGAQAIFL
jgi:hypothetical protein